MTWYDHQELAYQADNDQEQPEFSPLLGENDPLNDDEAIRISDELPAEDDALKDSVDDFETGVNRIKTIVDDI